MSVSTNTPTHDLDVVCRADLIREFGVHQTRRIDYVLAVRRDVLPSIGRVGCARIYEPSVVAEVGRLLRELDNRPQCAVLGA